MRAVARDQFDGRVMLELRRDQHRRVGGQGRQVLADGRLVGAESSFDRRIGGLFADSICL